MHYVYVITCIEKEENWWCWKDEGTCFTTAIIKITWHFFSRIEQLTRRLSSTSRSPKLPCASRTKYVVVWTFGTKDQSCPFQSGVNLNWSLWLTGLRWTVLLFFESQSENNVSFKDLQNQRVVVPTLEYHNRNWTWTDMLMELKKDYKSAIVQQTIKSAIGMKGSNDVAGLVSPKSKRFVVWVEETAMSNLWSPWNLASSSSSYMN